MRWISAFVHDLHYALRSLVRSPRFAIPAICAVAVGIGCAAAVFSVVDRILFRDPPFPAGSCVVSVGVMAPIVDGEFVFAKQALDWKRAQTPFTAMSAMGGSFDCDLTDVNPERLACADADADFLPTFGVNPLLGRNFTREEDTPKGPKAVLISYDLWVSRFAQDRNVVGKTISLDGEQNRITGVLPHDFELPSMARVAVLLPLQLQPGAQGGPGRTVRMFGRLRPGVSGAQAESAMLPLFRDFVNAAPPPFRKVLKLRVRSLKDFQVHDSQLAAKLLFASVLALLLIVSANVGNLILARSVGRRREFAVRSALGATPGRLISERLAESVAVALAGCALGCGLAWMLLRLASALAPQGILRLRDAGVDVRVIMFAFFMAILASVLAGLGSALEKPSRAMLAGGAMQTESRSWLRSALLASQVAVALVLLVNAVLLVRSLYRLQHAPIGINAEHVVAAELTLGSQKYQESKQRLAFYEELERRVAAIPGVTSFALSDSLPPAAPARSMPFIALQTEGGARWNAEQGPGPEVGWRAVSPSYFSTMSIPVLRGRPFSENDRAENTHAIIVNHRLAELLFGTEDPVGKNVRFSSDGSNQPNPWMTVVGVSADTENGGLGSIAGPEFYLPRRHSVNDLYFRLPSAVHVSVIVRSPIAADVLAWELRNTVAEINPVLPVDVASMQDRVAKLAAGPRFNATLLALFAAIGILLSAIGVYSVIALVVAQRTREIGIRMALGATPARIARLVLSQGMTWVFAGALLGLAGALAVSRYVRALLFGITPGDPGTIVGSALLLLAIAALAIWAPSRKAARMDPMMSLRHE